MGGDGGAWGTAGRGGAVGSRASGLDVEEVARLDAHVFWLARGGGRMRLRIGDALVKLGTGYQELGFGSLAAYARERMSRSGAWAEETRRVAARLSALPMLRAALEEGRIGWCMAELCARFASVDDEAEVLGLARGRSVSAMRALLRERAAAMGDAKRERDAEGEETRSAMLSLTLPAEEAWGLSALRWLVRHMDGRSSSWAGRDGWLDAVLAEGQSSLTHLGVGKDEELLPREIVEEHDAWRERMEDGRARAAREEAEAERWLPLDEVEAGEVRAEEALPDAPRALDRVIRDLCAELASRDLYLGRVLGPFMASRAWAELGYASETQYARERLGMSRSSMWSKVTLARKAGAFSSVERAVQENELGFAHAQLVVRVATQATAAAWVERARRRTYKHLREEVEAVEMFARLLGREMTPPSEEEVELIEGLERSVLSGEYVRGVVGAAEGVPVQISEGEGSVAEGSALLLTVPVQTSEVRGRRLATTTMRLSVDEDVALHYRQLEAAHEAAGRPGGSFVRFLCASFFTTWWAHLGVSDKRELTYRMGLYRCACPVCDERNVTCHHVWYVGRGGPDLLWNTIAACVFCHLFGEHGARLKVTGISPNKLTWEIGREPIMRVVGRELAWAA